MARGNYRQASDVASGMGKFLFLPLAGLAGLSALVAAVTAQGPAQPGQPDGATVVHGLAWLDELEPALAKSREEGKPVLFLSMFGRLDEEMPCANARTLRATLFADPEFQRLAREEVVLAWEMVRPVPKATIDLGNGEKIVRTLRGNAVLYLLDGAGRVLDAYPGVYTAEDLLPLVRESARKRFSPSGKPGGAPALQAERRRRSFPASESGQEAPGVDSSIPITASKGMVESPTLYMLGASDPNRLPLAGAQRPRPASKPGVPGSEAGWRQRNLEIFERQAARLVDASLTPRTGAEAFRLGTGRDLKGLSPEEAQRLALKAESRRNITVVRPVVELWLASAGNDGTLDSARKAILGTLLKVPYDKPDFGLREVLLPGTP